MCTNHPFVATKLQAVGISKMSLCNCTYCITFVHTVYLYTVPCVNLTTIRLQYCTESLYISCVKGTYHENSVYYVIYGRSSMPMLVDGNLIEGEPHE